MDWRAARAWSHHQRYHCDRPRRAWPRPKHTPRWVVLAVAGFLFLLVML